MFINRITIFKHKGQSFQRYDALNSFVNYVILPISFNDVVASDQDKNRTCFKKKLTRESASWLPSDVTT